MPGANPGIHAALSKTWMAGTSPAMTLMGECRIYSGLRFASLTIFL